MNGYYSMVQPLKLDFYSNNFEKCAYLFSNKFFALNISNSFTLVHKKGPWFKNLGSHGSSGYNYKYKELVPPKLTFKTELFRK